MEGTEMSSMGKYKEITTLILMDPFNPLNPELNPICYLLALLGTHHIFHVSRASVKISFCSNVTETDCTFNIHVSVHRSMIQ
jgi:transposase